MVLSKLPGMHRYFSALPVSKRKFVPGFPLGLLACLWTIIFCPRHLCLFFFFFWFACHTVIWEIPSSFLPCVSSELVKRIRCVSSSVAHRHFKIGKPNYLQMKSPLFLQKLELGLFTGSSRCSLEDFCWIQGGRGQGKVRIPKAFLLFFLLAFLPLAGS